MAQAPGKTKAPTFWDDVQDFFPFGLAPAIILLLTVVSGGFLGWQWGGQHQCQHDKASA